MALVRRALAALRYRLGQLVRALAGGVNDKELERALASLPAEARNLFLKQARHDQRHSLAVHDALVSGGHAAPELLQAALLHDVGKTAGGVPLLARGFFVVLARLAPRLADRLSLGPTGGWRRPFVVLAQHAEQGARLAAEAGCPALAVSLIRRHEEPLANVQTYEDGLLATLQATDGEN